MDNKMTTRNPKEEIKYLQDISNLLFDLNQENIELTVQLTMDLFDTNFPISFNLVLIRNIYSSYLSQRKDINIYIQYLQFIEKKEEEILKESPQIFSLFKSYLLSVGIRESNFILVKLVENNLIRPDQFIDHPENKIYFVHLLTKEQISSIENQAQKAQPSFGEQKAIEIIRQQKGSNFEEHKKNMNEGNPSEVTKAIRNDDAEQLQEIISNNKIDIDEPLPVSIYEKFTKCFSCDEHPVTLIQYAAFYGSIKCFKYLLVNGAYIENVGKYAVAGGNIEIIHLCEQNGVTFGNAYKAAIKFHRNDIFYYLYENKLFKCDYNQERTMFIRKCLRYFNFQNPITFSQNQMRNNESEEEKKIKIINYMGSKCIQYDNFDIFLFIENEGINIYDAQFVEEVFASGNLFIVRYLYEGKALPNNAIAYAVSSNNSELVKYVLSRKAINVNIYDICFCFFNVC